MQVRQAGVCKAEKHGREQMETSAMTILENVTRNMPQNRQIFTQCDKFL